MHSNEPYDPQQQLLNPEYLAFLRPGKAFCSEFFDCTITPPPLVLSQEKRQIFALSIGSPFLFSSNVFVLCVELTH